MQCAWEWVCNGDLGTVLCEVTCLQGCLSRKLKQQVMGTCLQGCPSRKSKQQVMGRCIQFILHAGTRQHTTCHTVRGMDVAASPCYAAIEVSRLAIMEVGGMNGASGRQLVGWV